MYFSCFSSTKGSCFIFYPLRICFRNPFQFSSVHVFVLASFGFSTLVPFFVFFSFHFIFFTPCRVDWPCMDGLLLLWLEAFCSVLSPFMRATFKCPCPRPCQKPMPINASVNSSSLSNVFRFIPWNVCTMTSLYSPPAISSVSISIPVNVSMFPFMFHPW